MAGSRRKKNVNTKRTGNTRGSNTSLSNINKNRSTSQNKQKSRDNVQKSTGTSQNRNKNVQNRTTIGNPRRQAGVQRQVQQKKEETTSRLKNLTKGNLKTIRGSHETTFHSIRNPNEEMYARAEAFKRKRGDYDNQKKSPYSDGQYAQLLKQERNNKNQRQKNLAKASKRINEGTKIIEKEKKTMGKGGKFAADLYGAGLGMLSDAAAGPLSTVSLVSRSFGGAYDTAKKEGADDSQAALYGAASGGLEAMSEKLFAVATPLRKLYGAGAGDALTKKVLQRAVNKAKTQAGKNLVEHGGKVLASALTEALEEMVVEGLEPAIANQIYAEAVGMPHKTSAKDIAYAGLMGGAMGGVLGGAGQIVDHSQGKRVQKVFGEDGVLDLAKKAADSDESFGGNLAGAAISEMISSGESIVTGQANELYKTVQRQQAKDKQRNQNSRAAADSMIKKNNYVEPSIIDPQTGEELLRRNTALQFEKAKAEAIEMSADMQLPDMTVEQIADSIARIQTGIARTTDVNLFALSNHAAREVYARITGKELPNTNEGTRDFLWNQVAQNRVAIAEAETLDASDRTKGIIEQRMGDIYEASGQAGFAQAIAGIDHNNIAELEATVIAYDDLYRAGRRNLPMEEVMAMGNPFHAKAPKELREAAYKAGQEDRFRAADTAKGMQLVLGQKASKNRSMGRKTGSKGKLITDAMSEEMRQELPATQMALLRTLARTFNINIHVADSLAGNANGMYLDGEVHLSITGDRPFAYISMHEITHHMRVYAPMEYNQLKELIRSSWGNRGDMDAAVEAKVAHYAENNVELSYEEALDEIIADSTYEILQDEEFVEELCRSHRNIAQALLDAIKKVISKIRIALAEGETFTPAQNANLLSELGILKDFERIWTNGLMRAAENRAAVGTVSEMERVAKFSLMEFEDGKRFVQIDGDTSRFDGLSEREQGALATKIIKEKFSGKVIGLDNKVYVNGRGAGEYGFPVKKLGAVEHDAKMRASSELDNIVDAGFNFRNRPDGEDGHVHEDVIDGFDYFDMIFKLGDKYFQGVINIKNVKNGKLFKDLTKIKDVTEDISSSYGKNPKSTFLRTSSMDSIPDSQQNDNKKFSLKDIKDKYAEKTDYLVLSENEQFVTINNMVVKEEKRKGGIGQQILNDIVRYADEEGKAIKLTPTSEFGTKEKLKKWYKANGFVENKGKNADLTIMDTMYRLPQKPKFSLPDSDDIYDYINTHETEFAEMPPVKDYERAGREVQTKSVEELQQQVEILKKDKRLTHGKELDQSSIRAEMTELIKLLMSHSEGARSVYDRKLVKVGMDNASIIYKAFKEGDIASVANTAYYAAKNIVEDLKFIDDTAFIHYKELRDIMRSTAITISEADKADIPEYNNFLKSNFGRLKIVNEGGMPVDDLYTTLAESYPNLFDIEVTHPADQLMAMADVREALEPYDVMLSAEEAEQLVKETAHDIIEISLRGKPWKSWADRQKEVYDSKLKTMKAMHKEALNDLKIKERMRATRMVDKEKLKAKAYKEKLKDGKARAKANSSIMKNYKWLADRLVKPTDDKHLPEGYEAAVEDLLLSLDLQTERSKKLQKKTGKVATKTQKQLDLYVVLDVLKLKYEEMYNTDSGDIPAYYDDDFPALIEQIKATIQAGSVDQLDTADLQSVDMLLKSIVHQMNDINKSISDSIKETRSEMGERIIWETIEKENQAKKGTKGTEFLPLLKSFFASETICPPDKFEIMGGGMYEMYMDLRRGFDQHIRNVKLIHEEFQKITGKMFNKKLPGSKMDKWKDERSIKKFETVEGKTLELSAVQRMSIYCLHKREQAINHMVGSGIKVMGLRPKNKLKAKFIKPIMHGDTYRLSIENIEEIISTLTPEQIEIADKIQNLMNTICKDWGNEASLKLKGYLKFLEENYFPISSSGNYINRNPDMKDVLETVLNFSMTKSTVPGANNPIVVGDIFSVATDHMVKMSMYNALAEKIANFKAVLNYKKKSDQGTDITSVRNEIEAMYGARCNKYIDQFIVDISSASKEDDSAFLSIMNKALSNIKVAKVAASFRVAIQQPISVMRAFAVLSPKWFMVSKKRFNIAASIKEMQEHCPIAAWKAMGFYDTDMAKGMEEIVLNRWRIRDITLAGYGLLDNVSWSFIWEACKAKVKSEHPELEQGTPEYWERCNVEASYVYDRTQVVDSMFHRSQIMRRKNFALKATTTFQSEAIKTMNMYRTLLIQGLQSARTGNKGAFAKAIGGTLALYLAYGPMLALSQALIDTFRDAYDDYDDDEETFAGNFMENLINNYNPLNLWPGLSEVPSLVQGYGISNLAVDGIEKLYDSLKGMYDYFTGESDESLMKASWEVAKSGLELLGGYPMNNLEREVKGILRIVGIEVSAAEVGEEESKEKTKVLSITDGSSFDNFFNKIGINRSESEKLKASFDKRVKQYERSTRKMTDEEKQEYLWEKITENYTNYIKDGNFAAIKDMRAMLKATGGDYKMFDERVLSETKTAMKKSIGSDTATLNACRNFLIDSYCYTEGKISTELLAASDTATDFQLALCTNDFDSAVNALRTLYDAGMTEADAYTLFMNRTKAIKAKDYSTGEFVSPVDGEISSPFGYRDAPTAGASTYHQAIDIAAPAGSPVVAADGGKVSKAGYNGGYGYSVTIDHGNGKCTIYNHLQDYSVLEGDAVMKGQEIARVGSTGISTGPHLDFQVKIDGTYVDPTYFL